jgi:hypothetical protein
MSLDFVLGIILILTFFGMVYYCIKGHNLMIGFFVMTVLWVSIALIGNAVTPNQNIIDKIGLVTDVGVWGQIRGVLKNVFQDGPQGYGSSILVNIFFGAFFGRVLVETNIASTLIRKVVELGGDRPRITLALLCIVTALLFTSMTGIGPVISIAVIIVPILLTLGISAPVTLFAFMGSIMAGIFANMTNFAQYIGIYAGIFEDASSFGYKDYAWIGWSGLAVTLVVVLIISNIALSFSKTTHAWAAKMPENNKITYRGVEYIVEPDNRKSTIENAPFYSWLSIILPVLLVVLFDLPIILSFIIASLYALITCKKLNGGFKGVCRTMSRLFTDGGVDVAPMLGFLLCLAMFNNAANFVAPYFQAVLGDLIPSSALSIAILFAVFTPLGFFRGPLNLVGCGAAMVSIFKAVVPGIPVEFLFPLFAITTVAPQHLDVTQSWVAWGFGYTKVSTKDYLKMSIPTGWIVGIVMVAIVYFVCLGQNII